ncbi:hypothetical protein KAU09_00110 [Candidatus Parcubacteria bacterium]|nr:hypothetical protein [Candidatus Parcubacteria bacterium]
MDIKTRKIKNKNIIFGLCCALILNLILFALIKLQLIDSLNNFLYKEYYIAFLINLFISVIITIILWYFNFWAAGDGKFFIMFCSLMPIIFYKSHVIGYFPSFTFLFNIYIPVFLFIFLKSIVYFAKKIFEFFKKINLLRVFKDFLTKKTYDILLSYFSLLFLLVMFSNMIFGLLSEIRFLGLAIIALSFFFYSHLQKFYKKNKIISYFTVLLFLWFALCNKVNIIELSFSIGSFMLIFNFIKIFIRDFLEGSELTQVKIIDLKPGMILSRDSVKMIKNEKNLFEKILPLYIDGLAEKQIHLLKNYKFHEDKIEEIDHDFSCLTIYKTFPFAPFIFIGSLVTIFFDTKLLELINKIISSISFFRNFL